MKYFLCGIWFYTLLNFFNKAFTSLIFSIESKGLPQGMGTVQFTDGSILEGHFQQGMFEGKVRQFGSDGKLQFVGLFRHGLPHGPVWLLPWLVWVTHLCHICVTFVSHLRHICVTFVSHLCHTWVISRIFMSVRKHIILMVRQSKNVATGEIDYYKQPLQFKIFFPIYIF